MYLILSIKIFQMNYLITILNIESVIININYMSMKKNMFIFLILTSLFSVVQSQEVDKTIFNAFKQGNVKEGGNCVSIALIKAAYSKYGHDNIFKSVTQKGDTYSVLMRDGSNVNFNQSELELVVSRANFKLKDSSDLSVKFKKYAEFCFAAMCKKNQILENYKSIDCAISDLNNGYMTKFSNKLLGLKFKKIKPHRANKIDQLEHLIIYNTYHAVYASNGFYDECWNESGVEEIKNLKWKRFGWKCMWKMCSISGAYMIVD